MLSEPWWLWRKNAPEDICFVAGQNKQAEGKSRHGIKGEMPVCALLLTVWISLSAVISRAEGIILSQRRPGAQGGAHAEGV